MTTLTFSIPNAQWLSSNQRNHWAVRAKRTSWLREQAIKEATLAAVPQYARQVHITAYIGYSSNGKADPANAYPTIKACIDGLVQSGLLIEDSHEHVIGPDMRRDPVKAPRGHHTVRLEIEEV